MCVVSMIGDHYRDRLPQQWPQVFPQPQVIQIDGISRAEFEALKREVEEMKALLVRAKHYDEVNGEPGCEMEEKVELLRRLAAAVGVDLEEVFG